MPRGSSVPGSWRAIGAQLGQQTGRPLVLRLRRAERAAGSATRIRAPDHRRDRADDDPLERGQGECAVLRDARAERRDRQRDGRDGDQTSAEVVPMKTPAANTGAARYGSAAPTAPVRAAATTARDHDLDDAADAAEPRMPGRDEAGQRRQHQHEPPQQRRRAAGAEARRVPPPARAARAAPRRSAGADGAPDRPPAAPWRPDQE